MAGEDPTLVRCYPEFGEMFPVCEGVILVRFFWPGFCSGRFSFRYSCRDCCSSFIQDRAAIFSRSWLELCSDFFIGMSAGIWSRNFVRDFVRIWREVVRDVCPRFWSGVWYCFVLDFGVPSPCWLPWCPHLPSEAGSALRTLSASRCAALWQDPPRGPLLALFRVACRASFSPATCLCELRSLAAFDTFHGDVGARAGAPPRPDLEPPRTERS